MKPCTVLAVGAHPDDIEFGCGGALLLMARAGCGVHLLVMTDGRHGGDPAGRRAEQEAAAARIGAAGLHWGGYADTEIPGNSRETAMTVEKVIHAVQPSLLLAPWPSDSHQDHRHAAAGCVTAARYVNNLLFYEVPSSEAFDPSVFVNIEAAMDDKIRLLEDHASQVARMNIGDLTVIECVRSVANFRGVQGRVKLAEGFTPRRLFLNI